MCKSYVPLPEREGDNYDKHVLMKMSPPPQVWGSADCCLPHLHLWCTVYVPPLGPVGVKCEPLVSEQSESVPCGFTKPSFHVLMVLKESLHIGHEAY